MIGTETLFDRLLRRLMARGKWMQSSSWQRDLIFLHAAGDDLERPVRQRPL
jgi:hypothetical protein